jgi:transposase
VQRGGKVRAVKANNVDAAPLLPFIKEHVLPASTIYTNEHAGYTGVTKSGYEHDRVHHSARIYVSADAHANTIEGFWSLFKRSVIGSHHAISDKYPQNYLNEYVFRYNHRADSRPMFKTMLGLVEKSWGVAS